MVTFDDVARAALALPHVDEGLRHGHRSWAVEGRVFVWERPFTKADVRRFGDQPIPQGEIAGLAVADLDDKEAVIEANASVFTIPHFDGYSAVLLHLETCSPDLLSELIEDAWLCKAPVRMAREHLSEA